MTDGRSGTKAEASATARLPSGLTMPGGFLQYDVPDIKGAIELAVRLKKAGRYRFFRGQRDASWKVTSSFSRLGADGRRQASEKIDDFASWVRRSKQLVPYLSDDEKIIAVAQHHGICGTVFIDFTTDPLVAAWFAADGAITGDRGAIVLVDPEEVAPVFEAISSDGPTIRFLRFDVSNLWRLQAQKGLFLEAQCDVERFWPFDRIVFPHTGEAVPIPRHHIYPEEASHVEQMIAQYDLLRQRQAGLRDILKNSGAMHVEIVPDPLEVLPELSAGALNAAWFAGPDESWDGMDPDSDPPLYSADEMKDEDAVAAVIAKRRNCTRLVSTSPDVVWDNVTAQRAIEDVWTGMRPHPYSPRQISRSLVGVMRYLAVLGDFPLRSGRCPMAAAEQLMDDPVELELGLPDGSSTRAFVAAASLWAALTDEARTKTGEDFGGGESLVRFLLDFYGRTLNLFEPLALVELFAEQIIPWQVAARRDPICFSPTQIDRLGIP